MTFEDDFRSFKLKRGNLKSKFTRKCNTYKDRHAKGDPGEVLNDLYGNVVTTFENLEIICDQFIDFLVTNACEQSDIDEAHNYLALCESDKCNIQALNVNYAINVKPKQPNASLMKLEPMKIPTFNGDIRKFPTFKDDIQTIVIPKYGENPCALRQCLGEIPALTIRGCEKSYEQMMGKLEEVYGDPRKLVDLVINDIKTLDIISENDNLAFIQMVKTIELCHLDLKKVSLETEMNSITIVSMIEKYCPNL